MVKNAAEGRKDITSVTAEQGCSHTVRRIIGNINKLVYLSSWITVSWFFKNNILPVHVTSADCK